MTMIPTDEVIERMCAALWDHASDPYPTWVKQTDFAKRTTKASMSAALSAAQDLGWVMRRESDFSSGQSWQPIEKLEPPKKDGVIIYYGRRGGDLNVGLAYPTVSGPWRDSEPGYWSVPLYATHWMKLPPPPVTPEKETAISLNPHFKQD